MIRRHFSSSTYVFEESKYLVGDGLLMTKTDIQMMEPTERTITQWRVLVDWDLVKQRPFVIVNPMDQSGLLYLTQKEYLAQAKVSASTDLPFLTICQVGTKKPTPHTSSTPESSNKRPPFWGSFKGRNHRETVAAWTQFTNLRSKIHALVTKLQRGDKMVSENSQTISRTMLVWALHLAHYAEVEKPGRVPALIGPYTVYLSKLLRNNGQMAVVMHLKVALFALYTYVAGNPLTSTYALGSPMMLYHGLPAAWGPQLRNAVRTGGIRWIRLMASLLNIYRAMDAPHKAPSVESIIAPHPDLTKSETFEEFKIFCSKVLPTLLEKETKSSLEFTYKSGLGLLIRKAGANMSGPAMSSICQDARAWATQPSNRPREWFRLNEDHRAVKLMDTIQSEFHWSATHWSGAYKACKADLTPARLWFATRTPFSSLDELPESIPIPDGVCPVITGRLHAIDEPAGKVRVVAICDYWTQVAMEPVHNHLFSILRKIGTDATFDQSGRVEDYYRAGYAPHWSFDLKSATDTIPLALYIEVMTQVLRAPNEDFQQARLRAEAWANVLTDREFLLPDKSGLVRYGTGQPMGALSSWASMALVHHALVQFANWVSDGYPADPTWFRTYLVLGDDVDISKSHLVADKYCSTCADLAIKIGLLKTIKSDRNSFEFANRRFCPDGDISPLSLKEELSSLTWNSRLEYAKRILARFGTRETNSGIALLRKATTPQQWDVLLPELTGNTRGNTLYRRTVQFLLSNPFGGNTRLEDLTVDQLFEWISHLPMEGESESKLRNLIDEMKESQTSNRPGPHELQRFIDEFLAELIMDLMEKISTRLQNFDPTLFGRIPLSLYGGIKGGPIDSRIEDLIDCQPNHPIEMVERPSSDYKFMEWKLRRPFPWDESQGVDAILANEAPPGHWGSPVTIHYVHYCIYLHNMKTYHLLERMSAEIQELMFFGASAEELMKLDERGVWKKAMSLLEEFFRLPLFIEPRFDQPMNTWLGTEEEDVSPFLSHGRHERASNNIAFKAKIMRDLEENLRGPLLALGKAFAQLGIFLPPIPQITFHSAKIKMQRWHSLISAERQIYCNSYGRELLAAQFAKALNGTRKRAVVLMNEAMKGMETLQRAVSDGDTKMGFGIFRWSSRKGMVPHHPRTWSLFL
jgi:hypothetical protein